jgi:hypothetical protein
VFQVNLGQLLDDALVSLKLGDLEGSGVVVGIANTHEHHMGIGDPSPVEYGGKQRA